MFAEDVMQKLELRVLKRPHAENAVIATSERRMLS